MPKFDRDQRTFETRLIFIRDIFAEKYPPEQIMAHCIQYKLSKSFEAYLEDLKDSAWRVQGEDAMEVLKRIDK